MLAQPLVLVTHPCRSAPRVVSCHRGLGFYAPLRQATVMLLNGEDVAGDASAQPRAVGIYEEAELTCKFRER